MQFQRNETLFLQVKIQHNIREVIQHREQCFAQSLIIPQPDAFQLINVEYTLLITRVLKTAPHFVIYWV